MKIKVYLVLFLIFNHCFVFPLKNCDFISIDPKDYDFSLIDRGGEITKTKIIDEKIIYAFNYNYLPRFKSKVGDQIYPILLRVNELKQEKYDLDFLGREVNLRLTIWLKMKKQMLIWNLYILSILRRIPR